MNQEESNNNETEEVEQQEFEDILSLARDWNKTTDDALKSLKDADKKLDVVLVEMVKQFEDVIKSQKSRFIYTPQYATSISDLLRQKTALKKDSVNIAKDKLIHNLKIRDLYKQEKPKESNVEKDINPVDLFKGLEKLMSKTK